MSLKDLGEKGYRYLLVISWPQSFRSSAIFSRIRGNLPEWSGARTTRKISSGISLLLMGRQTQDDIDVWDLACPTLLSCLTCKDIGDIEAGRVPPWRWWRQLQTLIGREPVRGSVRASNTVLPESRSNLLSMKPLCFSDTDQLFPRIKGFL